MVYNLQPRDFTVNQLTVLSAELCYFEIAVASKEGIPEGIMAEFDVFADKGFTEVYLPFVKPDIAPTVYFNNMISSAVFIRFNDVRVFSVARNINISRAFHV